MSLSRLYYSKRLSHLFPPDTFHQRIGFIGVIGFIGFIGVIGVQSLTFSWDSNTPKRLLDYPCLPCLGTMRPWRLQFSSLVFSL